MSDARPSIETAATLSNGGTADSIPAEPAREAVTDLGDVAPPDERSADLEEGRLDDARFWLAAIAESSDDAIVGKDLNGRVMSWNAAAEVMFGYAAAEIIGQSIARIIPPDRIEEEVAILGQVRNNEKIVHFETKRQCKDGRVIPVSLTVSPIRDDQGRIIGVSKIARNLSERDERERELRSVNAQLERLARHFSGARDAAEKANQAKSIFLAGMSHELRTPLSGILGYTRLLRMEGELNTRQAERVDAMLEIGKHLLQLITRVLDMSEIEAGHIELQAVEVDSQAVAAACLDAFRAEAAAKALTLTTSVAPDTRHKLIADPIRLRQVLFNLVGNAVKFSEHGMIEVRLRPAADPYALRIEVVDPGPGVPEAKRHLLFKYFERLDTAATVEGAGLGLALSARLAELMGGRLGLDANPAGGSVFWFELPAGAASGSPPATPSVVDVEASTGAALRVLVVDDVRMNRDIAASFLQAAGHEVTCVDSGAEAVAAVASIDFDVVLMDVRMPEMDGLEATRRIRALNGPPGRVPIVALTAQAFTEQVAECRKAGMNSHLPKPFEPEALLVAVQSAVGAGPPDGKSPQPAAAPTPAPEATGAPNPAAFPVLGAELPVLDSRTFERTARHLTPEAVASYLRTIAEGGEALLRGLRGPDAPPRTADELGEMAHTLAGSAGMFGFDRVAALGRHFERAVQSGPVVEPALANGLIDALEATLQGIHDRMSAIVEA